MSGSARAEGRGSWFPILPAMRLREGWGTRPVTKGNDFDEKIKTDASVLLYSVLKMKSVLLSDKPKSSPARANAKNSRYKPQARTEVMKSKILDAAQEVFAERGFDNTNLDLVAVQAQLRLST